MKPSPSSRRSGILALALFAAFSGAAQAQDRDPSARDPETGLMVIERPAGDVVEFGRIQDQCVQAGPARFGKGMKWAACRLDSARFVSTIGLLDFYAAQYCLVGSSGRCERSALMVFANRAYRPEATLVLHRVDPAGTRYDLPVVTGNDADNLMGVTVRSPGSKVAERSYFYWKDAGWRAVAPEAWKVEALRLLPAGSRIDGTLVPTVENLSAKATIRRPGLPGEAASVDFGFHAGRPLAMAINLADSRIIQGGHHAR